MGNLPALTKIWQYRIFPFCESVFRFEPEKFYELKNSFEALKQRILGLAARSEPEN